MTTWVILRCFDPVNHRELRAVVENYVGAADIRWHRVDEPSGGPARNEVGRFAVTLYPPGIEHIPQTPQTKGDPP